MGLSIKQQTDDSSKESLDPKRDAKLDSKKNSFIVEAETVNTESANIIPSSSIINNVLSPIISENEPTNHVNDNNNHNCSNDNISLPNDSLPKPNTNNNNNNNNNNSLLIPKEGNVNILKEPSYSSISNIPLPVPLHSSDKSDNNNNNSNDNTNTLGETTLAVNNPSMFNNSDGSNNIAHVDVLSPSMVTNDTATNLDNGLQSKDKSIDPRPVSKIIERPIIPTANSRDLLLTENKKVSENSDIQNNKDIGNVNDNSDKNGNGDGNSISNNNNNNNNSHSYSNGKIHIDKISINESKILKDNNTEPEENQDFIIKKLHVDNPQMTNLDDTEEENNNNSSNNHHHQKPNKTEFFAARLATAVGENEISDSEETFVYESAANSTKNMIYPSNSSLGPLNNQINDYRSPSHSYDVKDGSIVYNNYGISNKMSVPLLNTNKNLINRLKNTRHTSTGGILNHSTVHDPITSVSGLSHFPQGYKSNNVPNVTSNLNTDVNPDNITTFHPTSTISSNTCIKRDQHNDDDNNNNNKDSISKMKSTSNVASNIFSSNQSYIPGNVNGDPSIRSIHNLDKHNDKQSMRSMVIEQYHGRSPDKRLSTMSLTRLPPGNVSNFIVGSLQRQSMVKGVNPTRNGNDINSNNKTTKNENKRVLRTTVSKIFDSTGTPLRRYSGVPDNVNLEDYIEQADDLNGPESLKYDMGAKHPNASNKYSNDKYIGHSSSNKEGLRNIVGDSKRLSTENHTSMNWNISPGLYHHVTNAIKEEDEDESYGHSVDDNNNSNNEYVTKKNSVIKNCEYSNIDNNLNNENVSQFYKDSIHMNNVDDDVHSTFYYNHRSDLEARPEISDYEDDDIDPDGDYGLFGEPGNYESNININQSQIPYYGKSNSNDYNKKFNSQGNHNNRNGSYYEYGYPNEYTPLRYSARKKMSRNQLNFSPHDFTTKKSTLTRFKNVLYYILLMLLLLFIGFLFGFALATNKELQDFNIVLLDNVISSAEELIFDITVSSFNPGFFTITVNTLDMDVFAKSKRVLNTEALFLGSINEMEVPLKFAGGFFNRRYAASTTALKIVSPGNSSISDNMKWRKVIKNDYELVLRGTMKYSIPFFGNARSVNIQHSATVSGHKNDVDAVPIPISMTNIL